MPPRGLPGNANLEQLKKGAKSFQRAVRAGDPGAAEVVNEFHPRLATATPGSPELNGFTRADAQLVVARQFGFASWPKLKAHLELVARYARSPHEQPVGGPLDGEQAIVDEFLTLACLTYGDDDRGRLERATALLAEHDWLASASIHTIAASGDVAAARELLARDGAQASLVGGPYRWEPLLYLAYARVGSGPGRDWVAVARLLLEHGADPNAGYLWEGLVPPFTALTGALGGGGAIPLHPQQISLARVLLRAGADANDGQALYNRGPDPAEDWLDVLLEFGLGSGDGGPWRRLLGERQDSPRQMVEDLLMAAAGHGHSERIRKLLARGVDPQGRGSRHPIYTGRTPVQEAALAGHRDIVAMLVDAGAVWDHDRVDELISAAMADDREAVARLRATDPLVLEQAIEREPTLLVRAADQNNLAAVTQLIDLGFDVNARDRTVPLHQAAMHGNLEMIRLLLDHGADASVEDTGYHATPAGWAEHFEHPEAQVLLAARERPRARPPRAQLGGEAAQPGAAMRTVAAAFAAVSESRFDDLAAMIAPDIDWRGLPDEDGGVPRCTSRDQAMARMRVGLLFNREVSVSAFVEDGDRVLAHVHRVDGGRGDDDDAPAEHFVVAEVHDGQITSMCGYGTEQQAQDALHADRPDVGPPDAAPPDAAAPDAAPPDAAQPAAPEAAAPTGGPNRSGASAADPGGLTLRALDRAELPLLTPWFEDAETSRFLGGPDWPRAMLDHAARCVGETFRGAVQMASHHYLAHAGEVPIGYIDCGTFDRCTVYGGEGPDGPIILETIDLVTGSIAFVVDPELRGRGLGRAMITALLQRPELRVVELFEAGVDPENAAARRCLESSGFELASPEPDQEGMLYYRLRRQLPVQPSVSAGTR